MCLNISSQDTDNAIGSSLSSLRVKQNTLSSLNLFLQQLNHHLVIIPPICNATTYGFQPQLPRSWWCHQMETFFASLALSVTGEIPSQRPVTGSFDVFFDLRLNWPLSKQSAGWWFETPSRSLWRHCNVIPQCNDAYTPNLFYKL